MPLQVAAVVLLALLSASLWWGWFAWDTEYQLDPERGVMSGPYETWQGVGAALCGVALVAAALLVLRPRVVVVVGALAFTVAFAWTALSEDESGLAGVGVLLMAAGSTLGVLVVVLVLEGVRLLVRQRR